MRPRNEAARDQLLSLLRRHPGAKALMLAERLETSPATMNRMLLEAGVEIIRVGRAGRTRYYRRRHLRGASGSLPLYAIDAQGRAAHTGTLELIAPEGSLLDVAAMGWPVESEFADGVWPGLPYPLQDMRPQGFLGRGFARLLGPEFGISVNPTAWSDDDVLHILSQRGMDTSGNLILGDVALERWLKLKAAEPEVLKAEDCAAGYAAYADQVSAQGLAASSAAGEFPKFTAARALQGSRTPHVIVKFSGAERSGTVRRWADLLVAEHLALQAIRSLPAIASANSRILQSQGRTFLEVERFDRHGLWGRSALCSLETIDAALLPRSGSDWATQAEHLHQQGWLTEESVQSVRLIWLFGKLIGNSDMHKGNLSFFPDRLLRLAPVYDMLPMMYAPLAGGEIPTLQFGPALPGPKDRDLWLLACNAARAFWDSAASDVRVSSGFRALGARNLKTLDRLRALA